MTASPNDGEALVAARKAAKLLKDANLTYSDLIARAAQMPVSDQGQGASVRQAWSLVRELRIEIDRLRKQVGAAQTDAASGLRQLQTRLLTETPLRGWERQALMQIKEIQPRSREEFYLRWLARRYALAD